jgi:cytoskeleton protein RodZ
MATGIGETLRAARRQQGVTLADAAAETRVRESYLTALEAEDFAALGGDVYVKGFLRSYARFLRLDPEPLIAAYRAQYERPEEDMRPLAAQSVSPMSAERRPGLIVGAGTAVLVIVLLAIIGIVGGRDDADPAEAIGAPDPVPVSELPTAEATPTDAATEEPSEDPTDEAEPNDDPTEEIDGSSLEVVLDLTGESWMRVIVDGQEQVEGVQGEGETLTFSATSEITLRIGNAGAVEVTVNGQERGTLGGDAQVVDKTFTLEEA